MKYSLMALIIMVLATPVFTQTENVKITITGIENTKGNIVIGIYDSENTFPDFGKEFQGAKVKPTKAESINYTFKDLPAGTYAIAVWHDENDNQKIDKNIFGAPKEKYGFSNNKYGTFGPPDFTDVSFMVEKGKNITLTINMK